MPDPFKNVKIIELMELFDDDEVTTADKIDRPERAIERQAIDDFMERNPLAGGGMLVQPGFGGTRQGYAGRDPKTGKPNFQKTGQKMTVNEALTEIFETKKNFLNRDELKKLVDQKTGIDVSKNVLKPSRYPILKKATYRTSELMKQRAKENISKGKLTKKERADLALDKKEKRIKLFKDNLNVDIEIGRNNEIIGLDDDFKKKLNLASKQYRDKGLNTKGLETFNDPKFFEFFKNEYQTSDDRIKAVAERYGYTLDEWRELPQNIKDRLYMEEVQNKIRIKRGEVPSGLSVNEIVDQAYEGKKIPGQGPASKTLDTVYETLFRQEYDKLAEKGDPFSKGDLSRNVINRIKEMFARPGQDVPLSLFPANTDQLTDRSAKSYYQYIDPTTQKGSGKTKIFSDYELELFDGNTAASLNRTKTQEKIFNILTKGPVEMDQLTKELGITPNRVRSEINRLLTNAIVRQQKPNFLKGKENLISNLVNNLEASETLDNEWNRSLKYLIYNEIPDPKIQANVFNKIDQFDALLKQIQDKFPGVQVNYDHPAAYVALKNQNFNEFLNITPIARDINNLKSRFDVQSNKNLLAMNDARTSGNNAEFRRLLNRQTKLENTWSQLTGGKSSLGKIRLEGVEDFGTLRLDDPKKDLLGEFIDNISIRENIAKNLSDDIKADLTDLLERKDRPTKVISTLEKVTSPDLIKQDRAVKNLLLKLAAQVDPDGCGRKASASGGRIDFKSGTDVCLTKAKNYARNQIAKGVSDTGVKGSLIKRIFKSTNNFVKSVLDPKELFNFKKQFFSKGAIVSLPIFDAGIAGYEALAMNKPIKEAVSDTLTLGSIPRAMGIGVDTSQVIQAKNLLNNPNLSPAGKEYAQLIIDQGEYEKLQSDVTGGVTKKFNKFNELRNKIKNASTAGRFDYESLLDEIQATQLAKDNYSPLIGSLGDPLKNRAAVERTGTRQGPGPVKIDLSPITYQNFKPNIASKKQVDDFLKATKVIPEDRELLQEFYEKEFVKPAEFEQLMETPGFKGTQNRFAGGGIAKLAGIDEGPPPESGPNSQGLSGLLKRGNKI
jgi:predicted transcriptional regulator